MQFKGKITQNKMDLRQALCSIKHLSDTTFRKLSEMAEVRSVKKGECIIRQGRIDNNFIVIKEGIFRLWFIANGKERTIGFGCAGDPFTSIATYRSGEQSIFSFEAVTDAEVYLMSQSDIKALIAEDRDFADWMSAYLFEQLDALYRKEVIFGTYNATKRFETFVLNRPEIYKSVPSKYLAQYLNIAPETLSRIQSSLIKK